jgi:hypothetical protein
MVFVMSIGFLNDAGVYAPEMGFGHAIGFGLGNPNFVEVRIWEFGRVGLGDAGQESF